MQQPNRNQHVPKPMEGGYRALFPSDVPLEAAGMGMKMNTGGLEMMMAPKYNIPYNIGVTAIYNKTPVTIIQEYLVRYGIVPYYELIDAETPNRNPIFCFRVSFIYKNKTFTAHGTGHSKKEAKQAAARCLMDELFGMSTITGNQQGQSISYPQTIINVQEGYDGNAMLGNPIGELQEMCMHRGWTPPLYELHAETRLQYGAHLFTMACTIFNIRSVGKGNTKKMAKRVAAHMMLTHLSKQPFDEGLIRAFVDMDTEILNEN
ncbi:RISC-loading complex subunit tarbp2-like [Scaptodrosophila lebanonensis]|uniref:RISC-loading complex subunit tarbp2-like n=1 Tax=Drosophila lebanonensis TaxID=7225 RepID=A0A6J2U3M8_DROLE|nr:RISC-loading complex subunit tarbp2-like [Scaptodrosophila lebanonensis]